MPTLIIDNREVTVEKGATIMEAARLLGIEIPHFCYHPKLCVAGNCRICLVEVEKQPKPVASCAMPASEGMVVRTNSDMVKKARQGVMEFLLINHPLDCPVCDQGGECTLQDLAMRHGPDRSRFCEEKRHGHDKDLGPLVETVMSRCIHCTRCIRFGQEIAGVEEMGAVFRGDHMAVGTYVEKTLSSELAGNMIEICPVGALNSKPFHFKARGWELRQTAGICNHCSVGCHVRRDHLNGAVQRVMARACDPINETWICDKGRFAHDGLAINRLQVPQVRHERGLSPTDWREALDKISDIVKAVKPEEVAGLADAGQAAEELYAFQDFLRRSLGTPHIDHRLRQRDFSGDQAPLTRADLLMNTPLEKLSEADVVFLVGADTRLDAPLLNHRLRQGARKKKARVFSLYPRRLDATIPGLEQIVAKPEEEAAFLAQVLAQLKGESAASPEAARVASALKEAKRPALLLGHYAVLHPRAEELRRLAVAILEACNGLSAQWNGFNRIQPGGNAVAAQDMGVVPHRGPGYARLDKAGHSAHKILQGAAAGEIKVLFLLGCDPIQEAMDGELARAALSRAKVIVITPFVTNLVKEFAHVALPGLTLAEKEATLANAEGRVQHSRKAVEGPGEAKEDWRIFRALSDRFANALDYNTLEALRVRMAAVDHRYNPGNLARGELPLPCDHSPVTTGLPVSSQTAVPAAAGWQLILEPAFFADDGVARLSPTLNRLLGENRLRLNPGEARAKGIQDGARVRVIHGERTVELQAAHDPLVPAGTAFAWFGIRPGPMQNLGPGDTGYPVVSIAVL